MTEPSSRPSPDRAAEKDRYVPRWWHRWLVVDINWCGMPLAEGRGFRRGFLTHHAASRRITRGRRYQIERKVVRR